MLVQAILLVSCIVGYTTAYEYVGCYDRGYTYNDMANEHKHDQGMTVTMCSEHCTSYHYFALQGTAACSCGNDYSMFDEADEMMMAMDPCEATCIGGGDKPCGGMDHYSIYSYGTDNSDDGAGDGADESDESNTSDSDDAPATGCAANTKFNCGRKNPCSPLCIEGQTMYPGNGIAKYITCSSDGGCEVGRCGRGHIYDAEAFECRARVTRNKVDRCSHEAFNCGSKNPCSPICNPDKNAYPGSGGDKYVKCNINTGACFEATCNEGRLFNFEAQDCVASSNSADHVDRLFASL